MVLSTEELYPAGAVAEQIVEKRNARHDNTDTMGRWHSVSETQQTQTHVKQTTDRQADEQAGGQTDRHGQADRQIDKQIDREIGIVNNGRFSVIRCCLFKTNFPFVLRHSLRRFTLISLLGTSSLSGLGRRHRRSSSTRRSPERS